MSDTSEVLRVCDEVLLTVGKERVALNGRYLDGTFLAVRSDAAPALARAVKDTLGELNLLLEQFPCSDERFLTLRQVWGIIEDIENDILFAFEGESEATKEKP